MLKLIKKGDKYWLFEDSQIGLFSPSKFTINLELNEIVIVYENGLKSKRYNVSDCEIYDLGELTPFTTSSGDLFMQKLEELNCPCFQKNENIFNISADWGSISGNLSDQTDLQSALDSKLDKDITAGVERAYIINADGSQGVKATSAFKDVIFGYFNGTNFYTDAGFTNLITPEGGKIYVALDTNFTYRWSGSAYVKIGGTSKKTDKITYTHTSPNNINVLNTWFRFYNSQGWNNNVINANSETGSTPNLIFTNGSSRPILPNSKLVKCVLSITYASIASPSSFEVYVGTSEFTEGVVNSTGGVNQQTLVLETVNFTSGTAMNLVKNLTINTHSALPFNKLYFAVREKANTKLYSFQLDFYFEEQ